MCIQAKMKFRQNIYLNGNKKSLRILLIEKFGFRQALAYMSLWQKGLFYHQHIYLPT